MSAVLVLGCISRVVAEFVRIPINCRSQRNSHEFRYKMSCRENDPCEDEKCGFRSGSDMGVADDVSKAQIVERHMPENRSRAGALIEVAFAFVLTHVCYRSVKTFTPIRAWEGAARTNFTGSVVIVGFTIAVL